MKLDAWLDRLMAMYASRAAGAVFATCMIAFAAHAVTAPQRLPPFGALNLTQLGLADPSQALPVPVDADAKTFVRGQALEAQQAAQPYVQTWLAANPQWVARINVAGAVLGLALLLGSLSARTLREPKTRAA